MMLFWTMFKTTVFALSPIFLISVLGAVFAKRKIFSQNIIQGLTNLLVNICAPAFIFYKIVNNFDAAVVSTYTIVFLLSIVILTAAGFMAFLFLSIDRRITRKKEFLAMSAFYNCGYLPIALIAVLFEKAQAEQAYIYTFIMMLACSTLMWSVGAGLISKSGFSRTGIKDILNPPFCAVLLGSLFAIGNFKSLIPNFFMPGLKLIGSSIVPLSMFVLGVTLGHMRFGISQFKYSIIYLIMGKLIILPLLALIFVKIISLERTLSLVFVLQAAMPTAASIPIISLKWGNSSEFITQSTVISYIICIFTIPLCFTLAVLIFK
ncbi:MAG: AEC family transporter [Candidatus Omnitrophota bacterium]